MTGKAFPIFAVGDVAAARAFYERLGFTHTFSFPADGEATFVTMARDGDEVGLSAPAAEVAHWIYVDDVDATFESLVAAGAEVVDAPADQVYGERVATVRGPGGIVVHLGAPIGD